MTSYVVADAVGERLPTCCTFHDGGAGGGGDPFLGPTVIFCILFT